MFRPLTAVLMFLVLFSCPIFAGEKVDPELGPPPGTYKLTGGEGPVEIPFDLWRGDIRMKARVNGREIRMLLDNGVMWDQLLFFGGPEVDALGLKTDGEIEVGGGGDGDPVPSKTASGITISFPGIEFNDQSAVLTPTSSGIYRMWWGAEGQVCATFFKHFVVELDFDRMILTLTRPDQFSATGKGSAIPLEPLGDGSWSIPAELKLDNGRTVGIDLALDLGDSNPLQLAQGGEHKITTPKNCLEASLGFGIQGEVTGCYGRVPSVRLGPHRIDDVVAGFVSPDYGGTVSNEAVIGLSLLSRFNFVFDYPGRRLFIRPNRTFGKRFDHDMSGTALRRGQGDWMEVVRLYPGSPAATAGLKLGDRVTSIDGRKAVDYDAWDLHPLMRRRGEIVRFTVQRGEKRIEIPVKLQPLI